MPGNKFKILCLLTDAFGGHGGIAKFNRDLLRALCSYEACSEVTAFPRLQPVRESECIPARLRYVQLPFTSKPIYVGAVLVKALMRGPCNLVICGHINLLPLAWILSILTRSPLLLVVHGIDAWAPTRSGITNALVDRISAFLSPSIVTKDRFVSWTKVSANKSMIVPNCVDLTTFTPQPKNSLLLDRYKLRNKTVLMTLGRLVSQERQKGFDEILDLMPSLAKDIPNIAYLISGDGDDRKRLETKAKELGVADRVVFSGMVAEQEKASHYSLADVFVMPSRGEGFGIVLLEAMACGIPVVASKVDGSRDALLDGKLGQLVDPAIPREIREGILTALACPRRRPEGLEYFSFEQYEIRVHQVLTGLLSAIR